eukprot:TRINITY_DN28490_c2_g1_i1.p1 TRINITY_DN28490_c2_g1~~TRINITY_DN28490_c2_g1_i1.p1  ORF type:complete len:127 (+),score=2.14 TRINITY_DN28490_c2_g1_i1:185-565(+)
MVDNEIEFDFCVLMGFSPSSLQVLSEISLPPGLEFGMRPIFPPSLHLYPCLPYNSPPFYIKYIIHLDKRYSSTEPDPGAKRVHTVFYSFFFWILLVIRVVMAYLVFTFYSHRLRLSKLLKLHLCTK